MTEQGATNIRNLFQDFLSDRATGAGLYEKHFGNFENLGLPTRKDEDWKYTSTKSLLTQWQLPKNRLPSKAIEVNDRCIRIFSLNGQYHFESLREILSPMGIEVFDFDTLLSRADIPALNKSAFWSLNNAFLNRGLYLRVKKDIDKPIYIDHLVSGENVFVNSRLFIELLKESKLQLCENFIHEQNKNIWTNSSTVGFVGERSKLELLKYFDESKNSSHIDTNYIELGNSSHAQVASMGYGSQLLRSETRVEILGKNACCDLRGLSILAEKNQMDHYVKIHHAVPEGTSRQLFKSILKNESHYVFQGHVSIDREAQKTDADQLNKNMLLGKKCHVDTRPQLDVYADDVKATHGAAVGQLDKDERFYLESRGIDSQTAMAMLCEGFAIDVLGDISSKEFKKEYSNKIRDYLKQYMKGGLNA